MLSTDVPKLLSGINCDSSQITYFPIEANLQWIFYFLTRAQGLVIYQNAHKQ